MLHGAPHLDLGAAVRLRRTTAARRAAASGRRRAACATMTLLGADVADLHDHRLRRVGAHVRGDGAGRRTTSRKGILRSVYVSGLVGWVMVASFVLAMPDVAEAARAGRRRLLLADGAGAARAPAGERSGSASSLANYLCGLACMTSTSRMMYAFARDGGLPGSRVLKRVSPRWQTPVRRDLDDRRRWRSRRRCTRPRTRR